LPSEDRELGHAQHERAKILKIVGVTPQREIEEVRLAEISGSLRGNEVLPAKVNLTVGGIDPSVEI
jgi:hypothetical protein